MLAYYGYTVSPNQIETGEGFLICRNVPIARTGDQEYLGRELGLSGDDAERVVVVHRSPEEVFSDAALASFEGKPATDDHPPELLTPDTASMYEKGHAQNIRKGTGEWEGYVIADLHIHDRGLIDAIQRGKREISCGYECEYVADGSGAFIQKNIRGNHIAVVNRGRAGKRAAILDSNTINKDQAKRPERKAMKKNGLFFKLFGQAVKDKSPEEIEQLAMDAADAFGEENTGAGDGGEPGKEGNVDTTHTVQDAAFFTALDQKVDKLLSLFDEAEKEKPEEDPMDAAIKKLEGEKEEGEGKKEAKVVPAEEDDKKAPAVDKALAAALLKAARPAVAAIKDEKERKAVSDALIACVTGSGADGDIAKLMKAARHNAQNAADHKPAADLSVLQSAYDKMNPHKNGGAQ